MRRSKCFFDLEVVITGSALGFLLVLTCVLFGYALASYTSDRNSPKEKQALIEISEKVVFQEQLGNVFKLNKERETR